MLKLGMRNCPHCNSTEVYISRPQRLREELAILLSLRPVRCHHCMLRHYRPLFVPTLLPDNSPMQSRKASRQAIPAEPDEARSA
jgi:hypothetical protein